MNLNDLHLFVQSVESGGFAAASRRLNVPKSTISKRVAELEAQLGARLIHRSSRSFVLSDLGREFFEHARAAITEAETARDVVLRRKAEPSGPVRITTSIPTAQYMLARCLPDFAIAYPKVELRVHATDRFVDIVQEGYDIALRSHFASLPNSNLIQRKLSEEPIHLIAGTRYLAQNPEPETPEDLATHAAILTGAARTEWVLNHADGHSAAVSPKAAMIADESALILSACISGMGVTCLPVSFYAGVAKQGLVRRVLPEWEAGRVTTTAVMPHRRGQLPAVRAVVEFLASQPDDPSPDPDHWP
ncbi:MAG: LysR family transcriptional regulator [Alphaproteobacteria bacterium]|nr:LysR family transcriptional regulator [Alphaproteobacteria bacterium]MBO6861917.1 LysR family transcriptional regulator [Alphaproteobacteria bacterium]